MSSINKASKLTPALELEIEQMCDYLPWDEDKVARGLKIRKAVADLIKTIVENAPPCDDRAEAIRKIRSARMDANSAITHNGRY